MTKCQVDIGALTDGFVPTRRGLAAAGGLAIGATLAMAGSAQAATFTVSNLNDSGSGSLRQAVLDGNANSGADTITFASGVTGTIVLSSGQLSVTDPLTVQGPGLGQLTVSGNHSSRIFYAHNVAAPGLTISGLTLDAGSAPSDGGAILANGTQLQLTSSAVTGSTASAAHGGGISVQGGAPLTLKSSILSGNTGTNGSGGLDAFQCGDVSIIDSAIVGNNAPHGAGLYFLFLADHQASIQNSTITGNQASSGSSGGGGIEAFNAHTQLTLSGSTVARNNAAGSGGGVELGTGVPASIQNTIVALNAAGTAGPDISGNANSAFSLIQNISGATITETVPGSDIIGQDPQLGPLADNGGPTQTEALAATSPAVDKGSAFGLNTDQRGVLRPIDFPSIASSAAAGADGSDIGAFELQPSNAITLGALKRNKKKGTATQTVNVPLPDAGTLTLSGKFLKTQTQPVADTGVVKLKVIAKGKVRKLLKRKGKAKTQETVTYNPTGQSANAVSKKVKLLKKLKRH